MVTLSVHYRYSHIGFCWYQNNSCSQTEKCCSAYILIFTFEVENIIICLVSLETIKNYIVIIFILASIRALYLGDNDFEKLPADFGKLKHLQVVSTIYNMSSRVVLDIQAQAEGKRLYSISDTTRL